MSTRPVAFTVSAALSAACTPACAQAAEAAPATATPLLASYWSGFIDHWVGVFQQQNGVVMGALVIGAICLFIITRGKWRK